MVICCYHAIGQVPGTAWQGSRVEHPLGFWLRGEAGARSGAGGDCEWEPAPAGYCSSKLSGAGGGTAAAGTQYVSSTDVFAGGRIALTFTAAQLLAMSDIGSNTSVVVTLDPDGTISTTQGVIRLTVVYAQKV